MEVGDLMKEFYVYFRGHGNDDVVGDFVVHGCYPIKSYSPRYAAKRTIGIALDEGYTQIFIVEVYDRHFKAVNKKEWLWK